VRTELLAFYSDRIRLEGLLQLPDDAAGPRSAVLLCSGFQGLKEIIPAKLWAPLTGAGFACFAFDYRGFGSSGGERGRVIPAEQVEDVRGALTLVQQRTEVDPARVALLGWGFGGGIVVQAGAEDARAAAVVCLNGVGDAGRAVQATRTAEDWARVQALIARDRLARVLTGRASARVHPWEVVPLDPHTRANVDEDMYGRHAGFATADVSLQSAEAYYAFRPELVVDRISPRPLLLVHGRLNALHPIAEGRGLFARAGEPKELIELPTARHLDWIQPDDPLFAPTMAGIVTWLRTALARDAAA
jgi:uncharacterized protein